MEFDFSNLMAGPRGDTLRWKPDGEHSEDWKIGDAIANALCLPHQNLKSAYSARLTLADRLAQCGKGNLSTEERVIVLEAARAVYGPTLPIVAGRIEQFMDHEGPYAREGSEK